VTEGHLKSKSAKTNLWYPTIKKKGEGDSEWEEGGFGPEAQELQGKGEKFVETIHHAGTSGLTMVPAQRGSLSSKGS